MNRAVFQAGQSNGFAVSSDLNPKLVSIDALKPLGRQTRKHPPAKIRKLGESLEQFGFVLPIVVDADNRVVGGWALVLAARKIGLGEVPAAIIDDLDEAKLRLLRLALNRLGEELSWDLEALKLEFSDVLEITSDIDLRISGFEMGEMDAVLSVSGEDEEDVLPAMNENEPPTTKSGDLWALGDHRVFCGDAVVAESYVQLLGDERAQMVFTDPPWNIPIAGNVSGLGAVKHDDFAMACGEMTDTQFEACLRTSLGHAAAHSDDGATQFVCMHWSKIKEVLAAGSDVYAELKNLCVWNKTNAGMGSLSARSTSSSSFSRRGPRRISTTSSLAVSAATGRMSGTIPARTFSTARPRASCRCTQPPSPSPWSPTRSGTARIAAASSSIPSAASAPR